MKKRNTWAILALMMLFLGASPASAQGLSGFLKKVNKALDSVTGTESSSSDKSSTTASSGNFVAIESGGTMNNPFSSVMDVQLVGAYGKSKSLNYGDVYLVLKVKMNIVKDYVDIGHYSNVAIDEEGNTYNIQRGDGSTFTVAEGIYVKIDMRTHKYGQYYKDVPKSVDKLQSVKLYFQVNASNHGDVEFRDVPIIWETEES